jgi:hypothetical protein
MVKISSLFGSSVQRFSFSKNTSTPLSFSFLTNEMVSKVFLANLDIDLAEERGFEPLRLLQPTSFPSLPLQPLEYSSTWRTRHESNMRPQPSEGCALILLSYGCKHLKSAIILYHYFNFLSNSILPFLLKNLLTLLFTHLSHFTFFLHSHDIIKLVICKTLWSIHENFI